MKIFKPLIIAASALFLVGVLWRKQAVPQPAIASAPASASQLPKVVFEPNLKINGSILTGDISLYGALNLYQVMETTIQTLTLGYNRNVRPFPQYNIQNIQGAYSLLESPPTTETPSSLVQKAQFGFAITDLNTYHFDKSHNRLLRVKVVVAQGPNNPTHWKKADSVTYYSQWMHYKTSALSRQNK
jgi:hypothetical protein